MDDDMYASNYHADRRKVSSSTLYVSQHVFSGPQESYCV